MDSGNNTDWTLESLYERYIRTNLLAEATRERYSLVIRNLTTFLSGRAATPSDVELERLSTDVMLDFRDWSLKRMRATSWNTERRHLSALLTFAVNRGGLAQNPLKLVPRAPVQRPLPKALPAHHMEAYVSLLQTGYKLDRFGRKRDLIDPQWFWLAVVQTFFNTGMRRRQLVGLVWDDIDFTERTIRLRAETSKTRREWKVPLTDELQPYLVDLRAKTVQLKGHDLRDAQVFCLPLFSQKTYSTTRMKSDNVNVFFSRITAHMPKDMPRLSAHRIRHTTTTILANNVTNLRLVQEQLGHSSISTTYGYVQPELGAMRTALKCLPRLAKPNV